jgi:hypothetical protein
MDFSRSALFILAIASTVCASGQTLSVRPRSAASTAAATPASKPAPQTIDLMVPAGTPLKVALDEEVRVQKVGEPVHGRVTEPVFSFDKLLIPAGSEVTGKIISLTGPSNAQRTIAALNADFSPPRRIQVEFTDLVLPDGRHFSLQTSVSPGAGGVLQFVPANSKPATKTQAAKSAAARAMNDARQQAHNKWENLKKQLHKPGKMHRIERYAAAQMPYRRQYMDPGTAFNADLRQPLHFGSEPLNFAALSAIGEPPPPGSVVHALLTTPLNSATAKKGDPVDAVISQPLVVNNKLILPEGSHIRGTVLQVRPAGKFGRNGQLRIVFHQVTPPAGLPEKIEASLEGVEVSKGEHLALDSEGGAQVTTSRTRYLTTGIQVALAASAASPDRDAGAAGQSGGEFGKNAANGASGFKLVGLVVATLAHSRALTQGFGFYGAGMSVYTHFLARGRDVMYPKDMSMLVSLSTRMAENQDHSDTPPVAQRQPVPAGQ